MIRRQFLKSGAALAAATVAGGRVVRAAPNDRVTVGVIGVRGRGNGLLTGFRNHPEVDVKYVCDIDQKVLDQRIQETAEATGRKPEAVKDFRRILDDAGVDAIVLGTPDHWHAIPTILACQAGKDVYVEKPDSHNILESRTMKAAAEKYERVVQIGMQARSTPLHLSAIEWIREGHLGRAVFAKAWESDNQGSIGHPPDEPVPEGVDYDLWLGPAPQRPFNPRRFHSSWRWFFDYGAGDLGNDGVHRLDYAIWALNTAIEAQGGAALGLPQKVSAHGGKHYFDDDQEWPDNLLVTYEYPGHLLTYEMRLWTPYPLHGFKEGALVYGDRGSIFIGARRWEAFDNQGTRIAGVDEDLRDDRHIANFVECMRTREKPNGDIGTVGHTASMLCHLGNAAWRAGRSLEYDPEMGSFVGDAEANRFLTREEYRDPWQLPDIRKL
jgi:predicted dehydrogenase